MREIKFRAWDKERKDMYYINDFYWFEEEGVHDSNGEGHYANYILMQYTGLKDRNGTEIYEGDIVIATYYEDGCKDSPVHERGEVIFKDGSFVLKCGEDDFWDHTELRFLNMTNNELEVIGNIYEHPHLLKTED